MPYYPNIPAATDNPSQSQPLIQANFMALNNVYGFGSGLEGDHSPFNDTGANQGNHAQSTYYDRTSTLPTAPGAGNVVVYGQTNSSITMPYYLRDGAVTVFPVSPIKALATFLTQPGEGSVPFSASTSFNITSITTAGTGTTQTFTITLTNPCKSSASPGYGVLVQFGGIGATTSGYGISSTTVFTASLFNPSGVPHPIGVTVVVLEF